MRAIFQDPYSSLNPRMTVGQTVREPIQLHSRDVGKQDMDRQALELLDVCGLPRAIAERYPHEMSGGQRQRVGIARALALKPQFIVCDEAVSALDVSIQAQIINLLEDLQAEFGLTYLFIGHDLSVIRHLCQRVAVMYLGKLVEIADCDDLFENPMHPYARALLDAVPIPDPALEEEREHRVLPGEVPSPLDPPSGCVFHPRCDLAVDACRRAVPAPALAGNNHWVACPEVLAGRSLTRRVTARARAGGRSGETAYFEAPVSRSEVHPARPRTTIERGVTTMPKAFVKKTDIPKRVKDEWQDAHDFDPRDPLFGLSKEALSGPGMSRRSALRLMAAAGTLSLWHLLPGGGARRAHAASGGTLRCGWSGVPEIQTIDPAKINQALQFQISSNVISGLMHIDSQLVPQGDLAESWTVSESGTEWTFKLREGVTFHNGDRFTAEDVVFTYQRSRDPENSLHSRVVANVKDVIAVDDHTVKFMLGEPQASFLGKTLERSAGRAMAIVSRGALAAMGEAEYGLKAVGTGPFRVTAHTLGQDMVLERFDDYYDPERPKLDKVIITPVNEAEPLAAAMEAGDIQFIGGNEVPPELIDRFKTTIPTSSSKGFPPPDSRRCGSIRGATRSWSPTSTSRSRN